MPAVGELVGCTDGSWMVGPPQRLSAQKLRRAVAIGTADNSYAEDDKTTGDENRVGPHLPGGQG